MSKIAGLLVFLMVSSATAENFEFTDLDGLVHARLVNVRETQVNDVEVGLDAMQKRLGQWGFERSIRVTGRLDERTYQILDGFNAAEWLQRQVQRLQAETNIETLFQCNGRDCGRSVQWASRVFGQRLLYGQDNDQTYWVGYASNNERRIYVAYSALRTESRQYLLLQSYSLDAPARPSISELQSGRE